MDMARAHVPDAVEIELRAQPLLGFGLVHERHMRVAVAGRCDLRIVHVVALVAALVGDVHLTGQEVDVDAVSGCEIEQMVLGILGKIEEGFRALVTDLLFHFLRPPALPGAELPAVAAGGAVAEAVAVDQHDLGTALGEIVGSLEAGIAAADDRDVSPARAVELRIARARADGRLIE
ncbi:hypothetical protein RHSP_11459 [Rhizobium freirei PRF 81]|uniref:Uncharacterized protein n=1 Tax=Rhizobium freirei PRF 81 TaxID=363754 RepID=N6V4Q4_9HYPH|nr:hypothetical protein RHSP_11459 [Rhizobium freirei PRF 81]